MRDGDAGQLEPLPGSTVRQRAPRSRPSGTTRVGLNSGLCTSHYIADLLFGTPILAGADPDSRLRVRVAQGCALVHPQGWAEPEEEERQHQGVLLFSQASREGWKPVQKSQLPLCMACIV